MSFLKSVISNSRNRHNTSSASMSPATISRQNKQGVDPRSRLAGSMSTGKQESLTEDSFAPANQQGTGNLISTPSMTTPKTARTRVGPAHQSEINHLTDGMSVPQTSEETKTLFDADIKRPASRPAQNERVSVLPPSEDLSGNDFSTPGAESDYQLSENDLRKITKEPTSTFAESDLSVPTGKTHEVQAMEKEFSKTSIPESPANLENKSGSSDFNKSQYFSKTIQGDGAFMPPRSSNNVTENVADVEQLGRVFDTTSKPLVDRLGVATETDLKPGVKANREQSDWQKGIEKHVTENLSDIPTDTQTVTPAQSQPTASQSNRVSKKSESNPAAPVFAVQKTSLLTSSDSIHAPPPPRRVTPAIQQEPKVQIGQVDVIIQAATQPITKKTSIAAPSDLASRHYLRRL